MRRLKLWEQARFGSRIEAGGDMHAEHVDFTEWAKGYDSRDGWERNLWTDMEFVRKLGPLLLVIHDDLAEDAVCKISYQFLTDLGGHGVMS